jgi:hypothetical protein
MTSNIKYIGMDVHKESISIAVMNPVGKVVMESVIETKASMILQFIDGLRGDLQVTFEEGTSAAWLYDLLRPHVTKLVVCDPRKNKSMREGNQNDKIDARRLAELLRLDHLTPVYHGEHGLRTLKELVRSYLTITKDLGRVMTRVKAIYRSWAIPCTGKQVYARCHRTEWLGKINEPGVRRRAEFYYQQLDALRVLRQEARRDLLAESKKHKAWKRLCGIPSDPCGGVARHSADPASLSQQAAAVELRRFSDRDAQQRRSPQCRWATATIQEERLGAGPQPQLQSRSEEPV